MKIRCEVQKDGSIDVYRTGRKLGTVTNRKLGSNLTSLPDTRYDLWDVTFVNQGSKGSWPWGECNHAIAYVSGLLHELSVRIAEGDALYTLGDTAWAKAMRKGTDAFAHDYLSWSNA